MVLYHLIIERNTMFILKILGALISAITLLLFVLFLTGRCSRKFESADPALSCWMGRMADEKLLKDIIVPGSHDAGTKGVIWAGETQVCTVGEQLLCGARYFDLRVRKKGDEYVIFHSIMNGAFFSGILEDIKCFMEANPSEALILDFQHFGGGSEQGVKEMLWKTLGESGHIVVNDTGLSAVDFCRQLTLGDARGKCIVFWGSRGNIDCSWVFPRNDNECTLNGMCLDSYYIGDLHKKGAGVLIKEAHPIYLGRLKEQQAEGKDCFCVLQCQLTDRFLVRGPWSLEHKNGDRITEYIAGLDHAKLEGICALMRDFLSPEKCMQIINLNDFSTDSDK